MIPFKRINYGANEIDAVSEVIESGMVGLGEKVFEFERELAKYVGARYAVALDSCTSALFLSLRYIKRTVVGVPSMTVPLVASAVLEAGHALVFTDVTDWVGNAYKLQGTNIWDSAHRLDKDQFSTRLANTGVLCFSFYPTKSIGSADGGAIVTDDKEFADWVRIKSCYGRDQKAEYKNSWEYDIKTVGYKRHYTNLQAAICLEQLKKLPAMDKRRREIRDRYNEAFLLDNKSLYLYRISVKDRDKFIKNTQDQMQCGVHFKPLHTMEAFKNVPVWGNKENIEIVYEHTVSLPFYDLMTDKEVETVIELCLKHENK